MHTAMHADISMVKRLQSVAVKNLRQRRFACNKILLLVMQVSHGLSEEIRTRGSLADI